MYQCEAGMQDVMQMCGNFDANKSTKGASKLRRDLINGEIANLRDLLPLPSSTRQRLSQLQLMALVCVYVRKANYFQQVFKRYHELGHPYSTPNIGFSKALSGFLIMMTQNGKLLYISDNAAEYLGHSMEDLLIHGDSVYDIIDKADHGTVQTELLRSTNMQNPPGEETRLFLCRMNVSRNARRQMRFGDQKVVLLQGHYLSFLPLCSRNEPVFVATCTPVAMPETRECVVQGATNIFTSIHAMDMKFMHIDKNGEYYLGYTRQEIGGVSWYQLIHWSYMREAQSKHRLISQSEQEKSCILLLKIQKRNGDWIWIHCVLQVKDSSDSSSSSASNSSSQQQSQQQHHQSVIVATNQVLSEREASVMRVNAWLYHYYTVQTKLQYGLAYQEAAAAATAAVGANGASNSASRFASAAAAAYFPTTQLLSYGSHLHHHSQLYQSPTSSSSSHHNQLHSSTESNGGTGSSSYGNTNVPQSLQSPHNSSYSYSSSSGHYHPYHHPHHHHHHHSSHEINSKESPLDFSIAAASAMYEFPTGTSYPSGTGIVSSAAYWPHHNPHFSYIAETNGSSSTTTNRTAAAGQISPLESNISASSPAISSNKHSASTWPIPSSLTPSSPSNLQQTSSTQSKQVNLNSSSSSSSKKKYSNLCPPVIPNLGTTTSSSRNSKHSSSSGSNNNNFNNGCSSKKRKKHSTSAAEATQISNENSTIETSSATRNSSGYSSGIGESSNNNSCTSHVRGGSSSGAAVVSMMSPYSYHNHATRGKTLYKMLGTTDEDDGEDSVLVPNRSTFHSNNSLLHKEEGMTITAWPLTPSPIWEGQTHRVPDLQQFYGDLRESHHHQSHSYYSHHYNSHGGLMMTPGAGVVGNNNTSSSSSSGVSAMISPRKDQIHCVPSYQQNPYLQQFYNSSTTMMMTSNGVIGAGSTGVFGTNATGGSTGSLSIESGSPNKENRLPPTPESDPGETEENRPLKWETL